MKKCILVAALALSACGYAAPDAGQQAVLVRKPWFFGSGGVDMTPIATGSKIVASSTDAIMVSVTPTSFDIPFENLTPSNTIPLDFHTTVRMQVTNAPVLVRDWNGAAKDKDGNESYYWFWGSIAPVYNNLVRQAVKKYDMNQLVTGNGVELVEAEVSNNLNDFIRKNKMPVRLLSVTMGKPGIPEEILRQKTETVAQTQRIQTELAKQKAEETRKGAELARAEADNAYRTAMGQSSEQYVELKRIEMLREACSRGTCIFGGGTPIINTNH
jgi:hypothetical protein